MNIPVNEQPFAYEEDSEYALIIRGNTIRRTGDDGIEVVGSGGSNESATKFGVTGIANSYEGEEGVTRIFGITDRVLVAENKIRETGYEEANTKSMSLSGEPSNVGADGLGHDGINVRNVTGTQYYGIIGEPKLNAVAANIEGGELYAEPAGNANYYGYAVDIIKNDVRFTGDDGIEVSNSQSTLIAQNISGADGIRVANIGGAESTLYQTSAYSGNGFEAYSVAIVNNDVRRTADDGIEVIGGTTLNDDFPYELNAREYINDEDSFQYAGTGRILITENVVRDAGTAIESLFASETATGTEPTNAAITRYGSYDGLGGDGIHVNLASANIDDVYQQPFAFVQSIQQVSVGSYGEQSYDVQITKNDVRRTGDDGIEILGDTSANVIGPIAKFGASGIAGNSINRVLVEGNFIRDSGVTAEVESSVSSITSSIFDESEQSTSSSTSVVYGNAAEDARGADAIHVSGVGAVDQGLVEWVSETQRVGLESVSGSYSGYAVDIIDNNINRTADDGIEVANSDSTFISVNKIQNAGSLTTSSYSETRLEINDPIISSETTTESSVQAGELGDFKRGGADGISVSNVGGQNDGVIAVRSAGFEVSEGSYEEYAVVVSNNIIENSSDDGIEVSNSDRTRIELNNITNSGVSSFVEGELNQSDEVSSTNITLTESQGLADGFRSGADGISFNNVVTNGLEVIEDPDAVGEEVSLILAPKDSVEIVGNTIDNTADDAIQILASGNTLIGGEGELDANIITALNRCNSASERQPT